MTKIQNTKQKDIEFSMRMKCFGHWNFGMVCNLNIVVWDFSSAFWKLCFSD